MFILGHAGITTAVIRGFDRRTDVRWLALSALLPHLVGKPLALLFPDFANGWTRLGAHSLAGLVVFTLIMTALLRARALPLVAAYVVHLLLDQMWSVDLRHVLLWPFLGFDFPSRSDTFGERMWAKLR